MMFFYFHPIGCSGVGRQLIKYYRTDVLYERDGGETL